MPNLESFAATCTGAEDGKHRTTDCGSCGSEYQCLIDGRYGVVVVVVVIVLGLGGGRPGERISDPPRLMGSWGAAGLGRGSSGGALLDVLWALVVRQDDLQCMATAAAAGTSIGTRYAVPFLLNLPRFSCTTLWFSGLTHARRTQHKHCFQALTQEEGLGCHWTGPRTTYKIRARHALLCWPFTASATAALHCKNVRIWEADAEPAPSRLGAARKEGEMATCALTSGSRPGVVLVEHEKPPAIGLFGRRPWSAGAKSDFDLGSRLVGSVVAPTRGTGYMYGYIQYCHN
ncbi:hypothetical protein B0T21DRAFT_388617 [Apiosordaria backusii]|uniref:Uncharacterized protein n=1 Tax=Apiosordaria backusii TaxID=314023 RepID=A0AA40K698_9PEZI|nr:hypothetical protein B0T21DRAFT_388617 [Apiosordaria backusii]